MSDQPHVNMYVVHSHLHNRWFEAAAHKWASEHGYGLLTSAQYPGTPTFDILIADVTCPDWRVLQAIQAAAHQGKPILALYRRHWWQRRRTGVGDYATYVQWQWRIADFMDRHILHRPRTTQGS